jgi:hypothetical protein
MEESEDSSEMEESWISSITNEASQLLEKLRNTQNHFAFCDLRSVNSDPDIILNF